MQATRFEFLYACIFYSFIFLLSPFIGKLIGYKLVRVTRGLNNEFLCLNTAVVVSVTVQLCFSKVLIAKSVHEV